MGSGFGDSIGRGLIACFALIVGAAFALGLLAAWLLPLAWQWLKPIIHGATL